MKVVLVNTGHIVGGGDATYTFNLAELLRQRGHTISFFAMQDERNLPDPNDDLFVSHIDFREMNRHKSLARGLRVAARAIYSREARANFRALLDRVQPDVVHLQNLHGHLTPSVIFEAKARGLPVFWTVHDYKLICPNTTFTIDRTGQTCEACGRHAFYQPLLKRCKKDSLLASGLAGLEAYAHWLLAVRDQVDIFLAPSRFLRNKLLSRGFAASQVRQHAYFVPAAQLTPCEPTAQDYFLFMGRIEAIKGVQPLLAACRLAPHLRLILAGPADQASQRALQEQLPPNAEYIGLQQGAELRRWLCGAVAVVAPSIWYENQPFSILEAFASHKPVIASDLGGLPELVAHQERGLLVPPGDPQALADAMCWLAGHPAQARAMGEQAYAYVVAEHSPSQHYEQLMSLYGAGHA